jgi:hypothetical protein
VEVFHVVTPFVSIQARFIAGAAQLTGDGESHEESTDE